MRRIIVAALLLLLAASAHAANPETVFTAARAAMSRGETDKATELFEQAVKLRPNDANYQLYLANAYGTQAQQTKNPFKQASLAKKAKAALERAVQLDPNNIEGRLGLLDFYDIAPGFMGGSDDKALQQAQEIKKRDSLAGHRAFARLYTRDKKLDLAHKEFEVAIREQPNSAKPYFYYALQLGFSEKNYKGALEQLETAARLEPAYMPTYFRIGYFSVVGSMNYARGEEALKKYLTHMPAENDAPHNRTWYWLGQIYEKMGKKADAKQAYTTSLKIAGAKEVAEALKRVS
jgi:cytochrome c-type biogenesis protein CcmH/NrfG